MERGTRDEELDLLPGDRASLDELFRGAYDELRRLAAAVRRDDPAATIEPTALVDEAWLKLVASPPASMGSRLHFERVAARAMRQVLVDAARRRRAQKRGDGLAPVTFDEELHAGPAGPDELLAIDAALERLAALSPRQAALVEHRFFGGLDVKRAAAALGISEATALRDWRVARAWLSRELRKP